MAELERRGSWSELLLLNTIFAGPFIAIAASRLLAGRLTASIDDAELLRIVGIEVVAGTVAGLILWRRGWRIADFGLRPTAPETFMGLFLMVGTNLLIALLYKTVVYVVGHELPGEGAAATLSWGVLILGTLIDPLFEELFTVAYNVQATAARHGALFAISWSAFVRFLCYVDEGPAAAVTMLPLGLIFAADYWRWRRLWPLVIAHGVFNFLAMMPQQT